MKKLFLALAISLATMTIYGQDQSYLLLEFMKVSPDQGAAYWETETFWQKIHEQRAAAGDIIGWDLWSLTPGDVSDGYQYLVVQQYNDPAKMMSGMGWDNLMKYAKLAYPDLTEDQIQEKINASGDTRILDRRRFMRIINGTEGEWEFKPGMVAQLDFMKVNFNKMNAFDDYHKAENDVFKPNHQDMVDAGYKLGWGLGVMMAPQGSDVYATHMTWNMFKDWDQYFNRWNYEGDEPTAEELKQIEAGLNTRDMRMSILAELALVARAPE